MSDFSLSLIARLARKELRETLRDRRTVITLVLMPILLYPLLGMAFRYFLLSSAAAGADVPEYRIALENEEQQRLLARMLVLDPEKDPKFLTVPSDDLETTLRAGAAHVAVHLSDADKPFNVLDPKQGYDVLIIRRDDSPIGLKAEEFLTARLARENLNLLRMRLEAFSQVRNPALPIRSEIKLIAIPEAKSGSYVATLIPLVLVLMTITGAVYPAIDLTAGERERGTLELLMVAPVSRVGLLLAKYVAVMFVAILTGVINLTMMTVTLLASGLGKLLFADAPPGVGTILAVLGLLVLFAAFFSAVLLAITSFARSFKEAQAYLIPVMLVALSPGIASLLPGMRLGGWLTIAPLLNIVLLARELLEGTVLPALAGTVVVSTLLYAFAAIGLAARFFGAEAVLNNEQGQWSELFRRPDRERSAALVNTALLTLALMFPAAYVLNGSLSQLRDAPVAMQMAALIPVNVLLFIAIPLVAAWLGRVNIFQGFALGIPRPLALMGGLLLGLTSWPFVLELIQLQERVGLSSMPEQIRELAKARVADWRLSPVMVLFAMAVVPAVVEELFFRGFLFNALAAVSRPRSAILGSAILFGLFHIIFGGTLSIERLIPSTLMGVLLGWVRWRGGSVWPGVLLHVGHNSLLLSAALFPGLIGPAEGAEHLPVSWYIAAACGVATGATIVWLGSKTNALTEGANTIGQASDG